MIVNILNANNEVIREEKVFEEYGYILTEVLNANTEKDIHGFRITEEVIENIRKEIKSREHVIMSDRGQLDMTLKFLTFLIDISTEFDGIKVYVKDTRNN